MQVQSVKNIIEPIAYRQSDKSSNPIANSLLVDEMLEEFSDLIEPSYKKWFAKRFYNLPPQIISRCASEARNDGTNKQRLFVFLIKKNYKTS